MAFNLPPAFCQTFFLKEKFKFNLTEKYFYEKPSATLRNPSLNETEKFQNQQGGKVARAPWWPCKIQEIFAERIAPVGNSWWSPKS